MARAVDWYEYRLPRNVDGRAFGLTPWCEVVAFNNIVPQYIPSYFAGNTNTELYVPKRLKQFVDVGHGHDAHPHGR